MGRITRRWRTPEGKTPLGMAHGSPPYPINSHTPGSIVLEQALIGPIHACHVWRPVLRRVPARTSIRGKIWAPFTPVIDLDIDFWIVSSVQEGKFFHRTECRQRAGCRLLFPYRYHLEHDLSPSEGEEPERRNTTLDAARLKLPNHVAEGAGVACRKSAHAIGCLQLVFAVVTGDVRALNLWQ